MTWLKVSEMEMTPIAKFDLLIDQKYEEDHEPQCGQSLS